MVQRPLTSRFMPGVWVFPGGAVDDTDAEPPPAFGTPPHDAWKVAALRELIEETGIWLTTDGAIQRDRTENAFGDVGVSGPALDPGALIYFSNWITPEVFPIRFDTRFFLAMIHGGVDGVVDGEELIDLAWVHPSEALDLERTDEWAVAFPTRATLTLLSRGASAEDIAQRLRGVGAVPPVEPRLLVSETEARILLPEDQGFDEAGPAQHDPTILERLHDVVSKGGIVPAEFRNQP